MRQAPRGPRARAADNRQSSSRSRAAVGVVVVAMVVVVVAVVLARAGGRSVCRAGPLSNVGYRPGRRFRLHAHAARCTLCALDGGIWRIRSGAAGRRPTPRNTARPS